MTRARVIYLRLDSDDVEGDQVKYLASTLDKHRGNEATHGNFGIRFQYDIDGTSHWDGKLFVIDVAHGVCYLRLASAGDACSRNPRRKQYTWPDDKEHWARLYEKIGKEPKSVGSMIITFQQPFHCLKAEDLHAALKMFQVGDVMFI